MPGDRDRTLEAGATEYVSKPAPLDQLHRLICSFLRAPEKAESEQTSTWIGSAGARMCRLGMCFRLRFAAAGEYP